MTWSWKYSRWRRRHGGAAGVSVDRGRAVGGELERMRLAERGDPQEAGDAPAAGDVGLQAVDGAGASSCSKYVSV